MFIVADLPLSDLVCLVSVWRSVLFHSDIHSKHHCLLPHVTIKCPSHKPDRNSDTLIYFAPFFFFAGGNSGVGKDSAIALAMRGARVIIACRDADKAEKAVREIKLRSRSLNVLHMELDLANLRSVREFCKSFLQTEKRLDILINNAGQGKY